MPRSFSGSDSNAAAFRVANSGCSEPHSASEMRTAACRLSPLPDRNGRKLVDDRAERHAGRSLRIMTLQGAKASIRNPSKARCCRERPMCRSASGEKILVDLFLCERRFIPPHQSLTRQLPPEGKPFSKCLSFSITSRVSKKAQACLLL